MELQSYTEDFKIVKSLAAETWVSTKIIKEKNVNCKICMSKVLKKILRSNLIHSSRKQHNLHFVSYY